MDNKEFKSILKEAIDIHDEALSINRLMQMKHFQLLQDLDSLHYIIKNAANTVQTANIESGKVIDRVLAANRKVLEAYRQLEGESND